MIKNLFTPNLLRVFRSSGLTLNSAIAELVDNSIDAGAKNIKIKLITKGSKSHQKMHQIIVSDDGHGMIMPELESAIRFGEAQKVDSLGVFGVGLKTSALTLGGNLSIITKKDGVIASADFDFAKDIDDNNPHFEIFDESDDFLNPDLIPTQNGTNISIGEPRFTSGGGSKMNQLLKFLGIRYPAFHGNIYVNSCKMKKIDWIQEHNPKSECFSGSFPIMNPKTAQQHQVKYKLVLMPISARRNEDINFSDVSNQGFAVFRNNRLIVHGKTFNFFTKHSRFNRFRGSIYLDDYGAEQDNFNVNFTKTDVSPSDEIMSKLDEYVKPVFNKIYQLIRQEEAKKQREIDNLLDLNRILSNIPLDPLQGFVGDKKVGANKGEVVQKKGSNKKCKTDDIVDVVVKKPRDNNPKVLSKKNVKFKTLINKELKTDESLPFLSPGITGKKMTMTINRADAFFPNFYNRLSKNQMLIMDFMLYLICRKYQQCLEMEQDEFANQYLHGMNKDLKIIGENIDEKI